MTITLLISTIVVFLFFCLNYLPLYSGKRWIAKSPIWAYILSLYLIVASVFSPIGGDKERYIESFKYATFLEYVRDPGWTFLTKVLNILCFNNEILYFIITLFLNYLQPYFIMNL